MLILCLLEYANYRGMSIKKYVLILFLNSGFLMSCQSSNQENTTEVDALNDEKEVVTEVALSFEQWFSNPKPLVSAHRGGPYADFPENALETFQNIVEQIPSVIIECDVSMTKDSVLLLMHDKTLDRTTTSTGNVSDYNFEELKNLFLLDNQGDTTVFKIPTLDATLSWGKGKAMLTLDVKRGVPFERVISAIESYNATSYAAVITYRVEDAELVNKLNPDIVISVSAGSDEALERINISRIP